MRNEPGEPGGALPDIGMSFDLDTLQFATLSSRTSYVVVFMVLALRQRGDAYVLYWLAALVSSMLGSAVMFSRPMDDIMPPLFGLVVYAFFGSSLALSWGGMRNFHGRPVDGRAILVLSVAPALAYGAAMALGPSPRLAQALVFAGCGLSTGLSIFECLRGAPRDRLWSQYVAAAAYILYFVIFVSSVVVLLATDLPMMSSDSARISLAIDQIAGILIHFAYLAMAGERANLVLSRLSQTDPLTGLANRRGLEERLRAVAVRPDTAVLLVDIDHFKSVNDRLGHKGGDAVLVGFAGLLAQTLRGSDIAVRWGGEEFLAVLPGTNLAQAMAVAERLRAGAQAQPYGPAPVTISVGVAMLDPSESGIEPATNRADDALYRAKASGRNRVVAADPLASGREPAGHSAAAREARLRAAAT